MEKTEVRVSELVNNSSVIQEYCDKTTLDDTSGWSERFKAPVQGGDMPSGLLLHAALSKMMKTISMLMPRFSIQFPLQIFRHLQLMIPMPMHIQQFSVSLPQRIIGGI